MNISILFLASGGRGVPEPLCTVRTGTTIISCVNSKYCRTNVSTNLNEHQYFGHSQREERSAGPVIHILYRHGDARSRVHIFSSNMLFISSSLNNSCSGVHNFPSNMLFISSSLNNSCSGVHNFPSNMLFISEI